MPNIAAVGGVIRWMIHAYLQAFLYIALRVVQKVGTMFKVDSGGNSSKQFRERAVILPMAAIPISIWRLGLMGFLSKLSGFKRSAFRSLKMFEMREILSSQSCWF